MKFSIGNFATLFQLSTNVLSAASYNDGGGMIRGGSSSLTSTGNDSRQLQGTGTTDRMLYCGVPNKCNALGGNEVQVDMSTQHGVRCCTEDASVGWPFKCTGGITGVYGESNVPSCYRSSTFNEAVTICSAYSGGRLCSGTELLNKCTRGTGCSLNKALVWGCTEVSDTCASDAECCTGVCSGGVCDDPSVPPPAPTNPPTKDPTLAPSTKSPTDAPVPPPTQPPITASPTSPPTNPPSTANPTANPTNAPSTANPTSNPTNAPSTANPTNPPSTSQPTPGPTFASRPTSQPTNEPTNAPSTAQPTSEPTNAPSTANPTAEPTNAPSTANPTSEPTNAPSTANPTANPTNAPSTANPTSNPTNAPSTANPTAEPTNPPSTANPTANPTNAPSTANPTSNPTNAPSTANPTAEPTNPPSTANPTANPTNPPSTANPTGNPVTANPTTSVETLTCPPIGSSATTSAGPKQVNVADANTYCGIFLQKSSGDLIPLARSYNDGDWESAPGPMACPTEDVTATSVLLPELVDPNDNYVILSKDASMEDRSSIAKFLEMTTFGPLKSEIVSLEDGWSTSGVDKRATYIREQMDLPATSHREYWRRRTNSKYDATTQVARSDHPCSPNSKWRKYSYIRQDRYETITTEYNPVTFEVVPEEAGFISTLYQASVDDVAGYNAGEGQFENASTSSQYGYSGTSFYNFGGLGDYLDFNVNVPSAGAYPISFRYALGSSYNDGHRPVQLYVNDVMIVPVYDFIFTDSWNYWKYSEYVTVDLNAGDNSIKIVVADQDAGPDIDHLRVGKPPAVVMKVNGWPRSIAKNGLFLLDDWGYEFTESSEAGFDYYPEPALALGDLYRYYFGRIRLVLPGVGDRFLETGNPPVDFTGYEQYLPPNLFEFDGSEEWEETASDLNPYPMNTGQEFILKSGSSLPVCASVPPFAEEYDAPVIGRLPNGEYIQWTPQILLEDNGPSMNDVGDLTTNVLSDGGGSSYIATGEKLKCSNVPRSFINEDTCFLSNESTACSTSEPVGEMPISMTKANVIAFYDLADRYVYAIRDLRMESIEDHACRKTVSRWEIQHNTTCSNPSTGFGSSTYIALTNAITTSSDTNVFTIDVERVQACDPADETADNIYIELQVGDSCYTHVHVDHLNVYDFSGWAAVTNHPGGQYNIQKWAEDPNIGLGWNLDFPCRPDEFGACIHTMDRWESNKDTRNVEYISRLGEDIAYRDLPNDLKTDDVADYFGANPISVDGEGVIVCGSQGEVSNDPTLREHFDVRTDEHTTFSSDTYNNQKSEVWTEVSLYGPDQLRQKMAWSLAQVVTTVPNNINAFDRTEVYLKYYDIFVKHAFGNYRDIMAETSYSALMAEHLSYLRSKSHAYVYEDEDKRVSRADENYAREIMQLFTIGLDVLNDDGTPIIDPDTGKPFETYTNKNIEEFAKAWTGFDRTAVRGNYEDASRGSADNRLDPMRIRPEWRDVFPKSNLNNGFIGDGYLLCTDLPTQAFLKKKAGYRLLGSKTSPELMEDTYWFENDANDILRLELDPASSLYEKLYNSGNYHVSIELDADLDCYGVECNIDTIRVVKVGSYFYEYVQRACVQQSFYNDGKQIMLRDNYRRGTMCANPSLPHAREACCRQELESEARGARMERGVTHFYDGERMTWDTAHDRCVDYGKDLCVYEYITVSPNNDYRRKGYHWTDKDCGINVKVNPEGYVAIVHDAMSTYIDSIPWLVEEENTLNWFRVFWDGNGDYPGSSETNTCEMNKCKTTGDGSCVCKTLVTDSVVFTDMSVTEFTDMSVTKEDVMSQLFIGSIGPQDDMNATIIADGLIVHTVGNVVDDQTVFEVQDKGRTMYLKNIVSMVSLEGWEMTPQIYEAEDASDIYLHNSTYDSTINGTVLRDNTSSARGGFYAEMRYGDGTSYIEWEVDDIPFTGEYLLSFRFATDDEQRRMNVVVNGEKMTIPSPNSPVNVTYYGSSPSSDKFPLQRCEGDCDRDSHCGLGLVCLQRAANEPVPGCTGIDSSYDTDDFCVDIRDYEYAGVTLPTGGWDDDWHISNEISVNLNTGVVNTIRIEVTDISEGGANIDYLKIEGLQTSSPSSSFRNPPKFMSEIPDNEWPYGLGEGTLRDAQYETNAVLDHYFYQDNVAPFLCTRIMQRFQFSNPSPRFVGQCVKAFRTGLYQSGNQTFGSGDYGSLEAMIASIVLDKEATDNSVAVDPSFGSVKAPILKVLHLMRSMEFAISLPTTLTGNPLQTTYNTRLWKIAAKIGDGPYEFPTVFSHFLPEYVPDSGPALPAQLTSPEAMVQTMPNIINVLNGMYSMVKYGLSDCNSGFGLYPGYAECRDNGKYERSIGHLFYEPEGTTDFERAADLSLLLTAGRLSNDKLNMIVDSCEGPQDANATYYGGSPSPDKFPLQRCEGDCDRDSHCAGDFICQQRNADEFVPGCLGTEGYTSGDFCIDVKDLEYWQSFEYENSHDPWKNRCMKQLILSTGEYHSTNTVEMSGEDRATAAVPSNSEEPYKAIVYFYLGGGLDSYNMLAPYNCAPIDVHQNYMEIRGESAIAAGVGMPKNRLIEVNITEADPNQPPQPCSSFGIHESLPKLAELYKAGHLNFFANAGLMAKPVDTTNYSGETPVQLFAHNAMTLEAKREDLADEFSGTGVGGRMADILTARGIPTNLFSIDGQQVLLSGQPGAGGPTQFTLSSQGLSSFNANPSISNMDGVIKSLNNDTTASSGFYAETFSAKLSESLDKQQQLKAEIDQTVVTTTFPGGSTSDEFEMITRIMQTREARGSVRDIFFAEDGGYDTHSQVDASLLNNFARINGVISAFVDELEVLGLWESTVVVQFSEFARTLNPNSNDGSDHAWGGQHFMFGGAVDGGKVHGKYPTDFQQGDADKLALSRGRMVPTTPWDAMWRGTVEWFGIDPDSPPNEDGKTEMDIVLPMHRNFDDLPSEAVLFTTATSPPTTSPAPTGPQTPTMSPTVSAGPTPQVVEIVIPMTKANVIEFYNIQDSYVYAVQDLRMESLDDHACRKTVSRWEIQLNTTCSNPSTGLGSSTYIALQDAFMSSTDTNEFTIDVERVQACDPADETLATVDMQFQVGGTCYTHVHPQHLNVYDFTAWPALHPGGAYNIEKWASDPNFGEGWNIDFPCAPNGSGQCGHPMTRWIQGLNDLEYITRLGEDVNFSDLPLGLRTKAVSDFFGGGSSDPIIIQGTPIITQTKSGMGDLFD